MSWFKAFTLFFLFFPLCIFSQEYGYKHYDNRDGLAGSTVYCMTQDKDGFLWFGTEVDLCRFDGTHFKTFTREDGLPDNEIIQVFADSKGRIRRDKNGVVTITLKREDNHLLCILEDNGIGRKAARQYKSISPINYQSKGVSLKADRIEMYNKEHALKITMQI